MGSEMCIRDRAKLYELIWIRTIASQMESAELERTTVDITAKAGARMLDLRATGQVIKFDGFLTLYTEDTDDAAADDDDSRRLPAMSEGEALARKDLAVTQHFTEPPPRFSEASLVKRMEELGIGRPSTYASILQVLKDRGYVKLDKKRLWAEDKGRVVVAFLENFFARYVEFDFTASLEDQLDKISNNEIAWRDVLKEFWVGFIGAVNEIKDLRVSQVLDVLDDMLGPHIYPPREDGGDPRQCPTCGVGKLNLKAGKFGAFVGCTNYPECRYTRPLAANGDGGDRVLGKDPETDLDVVVKSGRFGPYIQLGEQKDVGEDEKPKRAGIPKGSSPGDMTLELALKLLSLPRLVGRHPESGDPITAGIGRFGPFVKHDKTYASLEAGDDVYTIGLNRAVTLIAEKVAKGPGRGRFQKDPGKPLGDHPSGGVIAVKNGRYGPYVTHEGTNATLPAEITPDTVTLAQAIELIDARGGKGKKRAAKAAAPKTAEPKKPNGAATEAVAAKPAAKPAKPAKVTKTAKPAASGAAKKSATKSAAKARGRVTAKAAPVAAAKTAAANKTAAAKKAAGKAAR